MKIKHGKFYCTLLLHHARENTFASTLIKQLIKKSTSTSTYIYSRKNCSFFWNRISNCCVSFYFFFFYFAYFCLLPIVLCIIFFFEFYSEYFGFVLEFEMCLLSGNIGELCVVLLSNIYIFFLPYIQ